VGSRHIAQLFTHNEPYSVAHPTISIVVWYSYRFLSVVNGFQFGGAFRAAVIAPAYLFRELYAGNA